MRILSIKPGITGWIVRYVLNGFKEIEIFSYDSLEEERTAYLVTIKARSLLRHQK